MICLENNNTYRTAVLGEPQLGKRGLYPQTGTRDAAKEADRIMNVLAYSDGRTSLLEIAELINSPLWELLPIVESLRSHSLVEISNV